MKYIINCQMKVIGAIRDRDRERDRDRDRDRDRARDRDRDRARDRDRDRDRNRDRDRDNGVPNKLPDEGDLREFARVGEADEWMCHVAQSYVT